jgi:hypothetical protein
MCMGFKPHWVRGLPKSTRMAESLRRFPLTLQSVTQPRFRPQSVLATEPAGVFQLSCNINSPLHVGLASANAGSWDVRCVTGLLRT